MIGKELSEMLIRMEDLLWFHESHKATRPQYTKSGFRAATKIFMSVLMDKMWELQEREGIPMEDRGNMATKAGEEIRKVVKIYTNIDTHEMYK